MNNKEVESKNKFYIFYKILAIVVLALILIAIIIIKNNAEFIPPEGYYNKINKSGDFKFDGPQQYVLEEIKRIYEALPLGTTIDNVIEKCGEPIEKEEFRVYTCYSFRLLDGKATFKVSEENTTGKIVEKNMIIDSRSDSNIKLSSELGTDITDLPERVAKISEGMSFDEIVAILGDKYLETTATSKNVRRYSWFDIYENRVLISFNENNEAYYISEVLGEI